MRAFRIMLPFYTPDLVNLEPNLLELCYILESVGCSPEREEFGFKNLILGYSYRVYYKIDHLYWRGIFWSKMPKLRSSGPYFHLLELTAFLLSLISYSGYKIWFIPTVWLKTFDACNLVLYPVACVWYVEDRAWQVCSLGVPRKGPLLLLCFPSVFRCELLQI